ncbi:MarR family winged helix-turn-helix transcriptional regulator [Brachybacterium sp. GCM10030267]|uniref:MarR family winged helix-turn-helix transcriptional regulator n=1 Tax=Brachybacterium sp. GCM10030267 TaxID=3273381 RepID=UPI00361E248A
MASPGESIEGGHPSAADVYSLSGSDPDQDLVDRTGMSEQDIEQIDALMSALGRLRAAEKELSEASRRYMNLNETDMRALHFLIVCENRGVPATPGAIAESLGISTASTTKLLDRLQRGGHVRRQRHPADRRALVIRLEAATRAAAIRTVGAQQARRVHAARRLTPAQRAVVTAFLADMTAEISLDGAH